MFRQISLLLGIGAALLAALLIAFSGSLTVAGAAVVAFLAGYFLFRSLSERRERSAHSRISDSQNDPEASQIFALGQLFEATLGGMREGLLVVDSDMRVIASNPAAHQLFTFSRNKLESQRLTELTRNPSIYTAFLDALKGNERSAVKVETHGSGRRIFDLRVVPLNSVSNGDTAGAIGVFFDITQIEKLERVRQEFLSNVSHELRTPLTAITAFVETLESGPIEDNYDTRRFLSIIRKNATRMRDLIDDILELSAIEAGNVKVDPEEIDLAMLISDVTTALGAKASSRGIAIENRVPFGTMVLADPRRLEQMLTNLIDNAIKFNRDGGEVTIQCENGDSTRILVRDTGEGIPSQHLERLFERFYRVDRARSREMGGTGLGLAIVKHLARAHGGEVKVSSELGKGTVFEIDLPRKNGSAVR